MCEPHPILYSLYYRAYNNILQGLQNKLQIPSESQKIYFYSSSSSF